MAKKSRDLSAKQPVAQLRELCGRIDSGKPRDTDLAELRGLLRETPDLWRRLGDMGRQAELRLIESLNVPTSAREAMRAGLESVRRDLGHPDASPVERLLIDQVIVSGLRLQALEFRHAHYTAQTIGIPQANYWDRTLSAAQRRYLRALEALARVRRLLKAAPAALQVNIGAQQVNVAGSVDSGA